MESNLPAVVRSATIAWGIGLGTWLSYVPAPWHRAGPRSWGTEEPLLASGSARPGVTARAGP